MRAIVVGQGMQQAKPMLASTVRRKLLSRVRTNPAIPMDTSFAPTVGPARPMPMRGASVRPICSKWLLLFFLHVLVRKHHVFASTKSIRGGRGLPFLFSNYSVIWSKKRIYPSPSSLLTPQFFVTIL